MVNADLDSKGIVRLKSVKMVQNPAKMKVLFRWVLGLFFIVLLTLFMPWTQNVPADGDVVSLQPHQQFQSIYSVIGGRLSEWNVIEGQHVHSGDTIAVITEIKEKFFDPQLISRTEDQLKAKGKKLDSYDDILLAKKDQISALTLEREQKIGQVTNKIEQDKAKLISAQNDLHTAEQNYLIAETRLNRADTMYIKNIISLKELETYKLKLQMQQNKVVQAENKLLVAQNDLSSARLEVQKAANEYSGKINKLQSEYSKAESDQFETRSQVSKLEVEIENYKIRSGYYYITASQDGYITNILIHGVGSIVKESQAICTIMPAHVELAIALYVKPIDLPLIQIGEKIRVFFDGWPAFVFSGWPELSTGTFGGEVYAIDKVIDGGTGKYRVLVIPDPHERPWPPALRVGGGARGLFLLNDVSIGYEIWRHINGFPPDFYEGSKSKYQLDPDVDKKYHTK